MYFIINLSAWTHLILCIIYVFLSAFYTLCSCSLLFLRIDSLFYLDDFLIVSLRQSFSAFSSICIPIILAFFCMRLIFYFNFSFASLYYLFNYLFILSAFFCAYYYLRLLFSSFFVLSYLYSLRHFIFFIFLRFASIPPFLSLLFLACASCFCDFCDCIVICSASLALFFVLASPYGCRPGLSTSFL